GLRLHDSTKTHRRQPEFDEEYRRVLTGREASFACQRYHQLRRLALMVLQGNFRYVLRGLFHRLKAC
ncbi:MAG: hypothetical protein LBJ76_01550, partial [Candidatus Accumulibacter sp.]|nr:hypothetical protein [Accumulibacter sp.]